MSWRAVDHAAAQAAERELVADFGPFLPLNYEHNRTDLVASMLQGAVRTMQLRTW